MFLIGHAHTLFPGNFQCMQQGFPGFPWFDHRINISFGCRHIRIGELFFILLYLLGPHLIGIICRSDLLSENDIGSSLRTHYGHLRIGPGKNEVGPQVPGIHGNIASPVCLAEDYAGQLLPSLMTLGNLSGGVWGRAKATFDEHMKGI